MQLFVYGILVFLVALLSGLVAVRSFQINKNILSLFLAFSGAYLFSITIVHILPEVFESASSVKYAGIYVLVGFFIQQFLEFFSAGVEHGHMHDKDPSHKHSKLFIYNVVIALSFHAFLEGTLLTDTHSEGIFLGIFIHKAPAAFALVSVLLCHLSSKKMVILLLLAFSISSPLGMVMSHLAASESIQPILYAIVAGGFLQISTTIVFESSSDHVFNVRKLLIGLSGMILAVLSELFFL
ncbi:MAG: ZIP family metal transporter [Cyclobacteriaceae bacterium]|nr:ZIP family metal transporter [Cyclobacteriaceae bacterium]